MIVDDDLPSLRAVSAILADQDYAVRSAPDGSTALMMANAEPPELILLDLIMPGMDGFEVCQHLKSEPVTRNVPVIFLSASDEVVDKVRGFELGAVDYISKPFQAEEVLARVKTHVDLRRLHEQAQAVAIDAERQRLARELHDSVTQTLYSLDLFANATQEALSKGRIETGIEHAQRIRALSQSALADMRLLIFELRPPLLEQEGLAGALRARLELVEARARLHTEFQVAAERPLPPSLEAELYAVAQEMLNNALKHSQAEQITVKLEYDEQRCCLTVQDDGVGFDPAEAERCGGFGLRNIRDRVEGVGGSLMLETAPGRGTAMRVEVAA